MTFASFAWNLFLVLTAAAVVIYAMLRNKDWLAERQQMHNALDDAADWDEPVRHERKVVRMWERNNGK